MHLKFADLSQALLKIYFLTNFMLIENSVKF